MNDPKFAIENPVIKTDITCPVCMSRLSSTVSCNDELEAPEPGCITICCSCGSVLLFKDDMSLREATDEDLKGSDPEFFHTVDTLRSVLVGKGKN